jgi:hypothetical protein
LNKLYDSNNLRFTPSSNGAKRTSALAKSAKALSQAVVAANQICPYVSEQGICEHSAQTIADDPMQLTVGDFEEALGFAVAVLAKLDARR